MHTVDFSSPQALMTWLHKSGIDTTHWGDHNAKTVGDLWQELTVGESRLQIEPVMRLVDVTNVLLYQHGRMLLEVAQEMGTGRVRHRNTPPAEKMLPGEDAFLAARRCLWEELHLDESSFRSALCLVQTQTHQIDSPSYPGLLSSFTIHTVEVEVSDLPEEDFSTLNRAYELGDPVRVHYWHWQQRI